MRPVIYQALARTFGNRATGGVPWGTREQNGVGRFDDFTAPALADIRGLGATHLWFTGVIRHARADTDPPAMVKGRAGSPYAVTDWYDLDDDLATDPFLRHREFDALLERTHRAGLKAVIDFVPNHVARTYRGDLGVLDDRTTAFSPRNNFYYLPGQELRLPHGNQGFVEVPARATGNDVFRSDPSAGDWYETVKLNYGVEFRPEGRVEHFDPVPDTWYRMRDVLVYWARRGVDAFRCDMAEMVPVAFWRWVLPTVKDAYPVEFIAEIYQPALYRPFLEAGFDALYDKVGFYDALRAAVQGTGSVDGIVRAFDAVADIEPRLLRFTENHDEQRSASRFYAGDPWRAFAAFWVTAFVGRSGVLVYFGQEGGDPGEGPGGYSGDDGRTSIYDYEAAFQGLPSDESERLRSAYATVLQRVADDALIREGSTRFLPGRHERELVWERAWRGTESVFTADLATGAVQEMAATRPRSDALERPSGVGLPQDNHRTRRPPS